LGAIKPKGVNRRARIGYGHIYLKEENLSLKCGIVLGFTSQKKSLKIR
jgi:hypothetical protein